MSWKPDYCTSAELKSFLRISDTVDDTVLGFAITAASRAIDQYCNRQFGAATGSAEWTYTAEWDRRRQRWLIPIDDLMSTTGLVIMVTDTNGDVGAVDDYDLEPINAVERDNIPWTTIVVNPDSTYKPTGARNEMDITAGTWGWTSVPDPVKQATLLQASRIFSRRNSPYGIAGSPDLGSELRLLAKLDVDVSVVLNPYRRWWAAT